MSRSGESKPFGAQTSLNIDAFGGNNTYQPNPGMPGMFPGTQRPSYPGVGSPVNPNIAQFYSAPTLPPRSPGGTPPQQPGGEPYRGGGYNNEPPKKKSHKIALAIGSVGAVGAVTAAIYGIPTIIGETQGESSSSSSSGEGTTGTGETAGGSCASRGKLLGEYTMRGSAEAIDMYGIDGTLKRNTELVVMDDDGYTVLTSIPDDKYNDLLVSYHKVIDQMPYSPGEAKPSGFRAGVQNLTIQKRGEASGDGSDGILGGKEVLCVVGDGGDVDPS